MSSNKLKEKLEKVSRLANEKKNIDNAPSKYYPIYNDDKNILNLAGVEATKGNFLKALSQYRVSSEERKVVRQEKNFERMSEKIFGLNNELNFLENKFLEKNNLVEIRKNEVDGLKEKLLK